MYKAARQKTYFLGGSQRFDSNYFANLCFEANLILVINNFSLVLGSDLALFYKLNSAGLYLLFSAFHFPF